VSFLSKVSRESFAEQAIRGEEKERPVPVAVDTLVVEESDDEAEFEGSDLTKPAARAEPDPAFKDIFGDSGEEDADA
jgi:hypothetical protein